ncbi:MULTISPECIES: methyl-accepting chemotaxis protein [unclassified Pseudoalteromonas]|uniref:methyl-accepting chemotaxis protein n=1 Tax=unclassified Pseudoalteromonas TaxID=194690 RepID=UPI001E59BF72|nr:MULTISPECIES: methyl-accepting chemotaxis protein [unclassified Pseudoalteromonas]
MLNKLSITSKIYLLGVSQILLMFVIGVISLIQMNKIGIELVDIAERDIPLSNMLSKMSEHKLEQTILFQRALLQVSLNPEGDNAEIEQKLTSLTQKIKSEFDKSEKFVTDSIDKLHSEKAKLSFKSLASDLKLLNKEYQSIAVSISDVIEMTKTQTVSSVSNKVKSIEVAEDKFDKKLIALLSQIQKFTLNSALQAENDEKQGIHFILYIFIFSVIVGVALSYLISRAIALPVNKLKNRLIEIADGDGDLTLKLDESAGDETGDTARAFNKFLLMLRETINEANIHLSQLDESSKFAVTVMQETVVNVEMQRAETEMVSTAVEEMNCTTQEVASNTQNASDVTEAVKERVSKGKLEASQAKVVIQRLAQEIDEASTVIECLVTETNSIGSVLDTIQSIAEQTNLLALNAAIEAARAGDTGRGFAVVADEVRALAQRTQVSTIDIQGLVTRLQSEAKNAVISMNKGINSADECLQKSTQTSEIFANSAIAVNEITDLNLQIATAAEEQSAVVSEINQNLINITNIAIETSTGAKNTSEANESIARYIANLRVNLNKFKV